MIGVNPKITLVISFCLIIGRRMCGITLARLGPSRYYKPKLCPSNEKDFGKDLNWYEQEGVDC